MNNVTIESIKQAALKTGRELSDNQAENILIRYEQLVEEGKRSNRYRR